MDTHGEANTAAPTDDPANTRPCAHCGKPVPQRNAAGRPFRYCRDNDGACQRASRNNRLRQRTSPGLAGHVARAHDLVDRLENAAETLAAALDADLSVAGVERQLADVRAEAAAAVAAAAAQRDDARAQAAAHAADTDAARA
ncbi:MAG TPA: serine/threonine protein kinase, partial [Pilimelia sp.]|nr:serine/threonine protein kinase [Pilimelia sp.]